MLLAGTVIGMSGLAVCNVAMPSFIREHFAHCTSMMTMLYTVTMTTGATVTAVAVIPMAQALGSPSAAVGAIGSGRGSLPGLPPRGAAYAPAQRPCLKHPDFAVALAADPEGPAADCHLHPAGTAGLSLISWFPSMLITMGVAAADSGLLYGLMQLVSVPAGMVIIAIGSRPRMLRPAPTWSASYGWPVWRRCSGCR